MPICFEYLQEEKNRGTTYLLLDNFVLLSDND
jgi:hypothetical protein